MLKWKLAFSAFLTLSGGLAAVDAEDTKICKGEPPKPVRDIKFYDSGGEDIHGYELYGQARIVEPAPEGIARALRIDQQFSYALLRGVDISRDTMRDCTLAIGVYIESIRANNPNGERAYGWVMSHDNGGFDRAIFLHDERFNGMGISPGYKFPANKEYQEPPLKEWIQIVAVWRTGGECFLYVNSEKKPFSQKVIGKNKNGLPDLAVGAPQLRMYQKENDNDVWIKEVKVFDRALNDTEVDELNCKFEEEKKPTVDCGDGSDLVYSCTDCTLEGYSLGCAGDCMYDTSVGACIDDNDNDVNCGDHDAPTCEQCDASYEDIEGCSGECKWIEELGECKSDDFKLPIDCGDHVADNCSECPRGDSRSAGCAGECIWDPASSGCIKDNDDRHIDCGDHQADTCEECDASSDDLDGCQGICEWDHSTGTCGVIPPVDCGDHEADTCGSCPEKGGSAGCAGECKWDPASAGCIKDEDDEHVDCGDHQADTCEECDASSDDLDGCQGECQWDGSTESCGTIPPPVDCGDHEADTCAECPNGLGAVGCAGACKWDLASETCVPGGDDDIDCGQHDANSCSECPFGNGMETCAKVQEPYQFYGVGTDNLLYYRNSHDEPWLGPALGTPRIKAVRTLLDGSILAVGLDNSLYKRANISSGWVSVPNSSGITAISTRRSDGKTLGIALSNDLIWHLSSLDGKSKWIEIPRTGTCEDIDVKSNGYMYVVDELAVWYRTSSLSQASWHKVVGSPKDLINITIMKDNLFLGVRKNNRLYTSTNGGKTWVEVKYSNPSHHKDMIYVEHARNWQPSGDATEDCIKPDASLCSGQCLWDAETGSCGPVNCGNHVAASCSACVTESEPVVQEPYQYYGVGEDKLLYYRNSHDEPWLGPASLGGKKIMAVRTMKDGSLLAVGIDYYLYKRANLSSNWVQVPNSYGVTALSTRRSDGKILGIALSNDRIWHLASLDGRSRWVEIPGSGTCEDVDVDSKGYMMVCDELAVWYRSSSLSQSRWFGIQNSAKDVINLTVVQDNLYLGVRKNKRLYTSTNYGRTWVEVNPKFHKNMIYVDIYSYYVPSEPEVDPTMCGGECTFDFGLNACLLK